MADRQVVQACDEQAAETGVRPGMSLSHARALLPSREIRVEPEDPEGDASALRALATWAQRRFSPIVAMDPPCGLMLDVDGCERLFHGERRLVNELANRLEWLGIRARVAVADTFGCAHAVARFGSSSRTIVTGGDERVELEPLPVEALRLGPDTVEALHEVGLESIGELMVLPRLELATRFGPDLLLRLDQATGEAIETITPIRVRQQLRVERVFDGPVKELEVVIRSVEMLLEPLTEMLERREAGARRIDLVLDRLDVEPVRQSITLSRPSRDRRHLWMLLKPKVESAHLGYGVERVELTAPRTTPLPHAQSERWRDRDAIGADGVDRAGGELVDTLAGRLGAQRVIGVEPRESYFPERAWRRRSLLHDREAWSKDAEKVPVKPAERPTVLFPRPERIDVIARAPEGPPIWLRWRHGEFRVITSAGPERIAPEWWGAWTSSGRDYFRLQADNGRWLWVFRDLASGTWFVHGEWG